ncbi:MAG: glycosyltransferase family 4 protein, partial [Oscillospiraceae bacterium]|nr:glycosyltransferase family 4 protein [Oscillospiraceae bacterium]
EEHLKAKVKSLGRGDNIIFTGFISDVDKLMNITDIQVNASFGTEATSLALLEGMSLGIPAVVSDFGGNPGVIKSGKNGFVVPKQNSHALAEGIEKLLTDEKLYSELSEGSKNIFKETFTAEAMTRNTENLYINTIKGGK